MFVVIGKIEAETKNNKRKRLEACRIVDTETKEVQDISIGRIKNAIKGGVHVVGFSFDKENNNIHQENRLIKWSRIPALNGSGELINEEDAKYMVVFGWHGFVEMKKYHMFNWKGEEVVLSAEEVVNKLKSKEISGINLAKDRLYFFKSFGTEIICGGQ